MKAKIQAYIRGVFERDRYVESCKSSWNLHNKLQLQIIISCGFFILSVANVISQSYMMLFLTAFGCITNAVFAVLAQKRNKGSLCALSAISTCSLLFGFFVIYGGNDGFACLWVVLLPFVSMVVMNFMIGLCASVFFQLFLMVVFWTPIREMLLYHYNDQFCLRFPLFFLVSFILALTLTISLRRSEYNEYRHLQELEEMTTTARVLARTDSLTKLANRRSAYEEFETNYASEGQAHCIVMGDIDSLKKLNDTYGHNFGDEVLITVSQYILDLLPRDYLKVRWGGDEFLLAANAPIDEVYRQVENLRKAIANHEFRNSGTVLRIMVTFGIAEYAGKEDLPKAIIAADDRLYNGKKAKKNCTIMA